MSHPIEFTFTIVCDEGVEPSYHVIGEVLGADGVVGRVKAEFSSLEDAEQCYAAHEETAIKRNFRCMSRNAMPKGDESWITMSRWRNNIE